MDDLFHYFFIAKLPLKITLSAGTAIQEGNQSTSTLPPSPEEEYNLQKIPRRNFGARRITQKESDTNVIHPIVSNSAFY